jgi:DNA-binding transcriptional MerR regulator
MNRAWQIGELARQLGINPKTIRYYETIALLAPPTRTEAGYRLYGEADRQRLAFIGRAKQLGLSLQEIGEVLAIRDGGGRPCEHVVGLIDGKLDWVDAQLQSLQEFRRELVTLRKEAEEASRHCGEDTGVCPIIERRTDRGNASRGTSLTRPNGGEGRGSRR